MTSRACTLALLLAFLATAAQAQHIRVSDRTWHGWRGGFETGLTESFHTGKVPLTASGDNSIWTTGNEANFHLFGFVEKGMSRSFVLGFRGGWDPMSATMEGNYKEAFRIADPQTGEPVDLVRKHQMEYILRYFTIGGYAKLYPMGGPGLFLGAGVNVSMLTQKRYVDNAVIVEPQFAAGIESVPQTGTLAETAALRASFDVLLGYEVFYMYAFVSPVVRYNMGFGHPVTASYGDDWNINNVHVGISFAFPLTN
jgi:hypothetical protein